MRRFVLTAACACMGIAVPFAAVQAQSAANTQHSIPQMRAYPAQVNLNNPARLTPGVNGVPGSAVFLPTFHPYAPGYNYNRAGGTYFVNNNNPYGYAPGATGFANSGQFYAVMGGPAPSSPFAGNLSPVVPNWNSFPGSNPNGYPPNFYNFNVPQPYPPMFNAPIVGQSNGFFPNQQPVMQQPFQPNNFGVQNVPGLNGFGNPR